MATQPTVPTGSPRAPWYRQQLWIVVLLIFIPPVGAVLAWRYRPAWPKAVRLALVVWGVIGAFYYLGRVAAPAQPATTAQGTPAAQQAAAAPAAPTLAPTPRPTVPPTTPPEPTSAIPNFGEGTKLVGADIQPGTYRSKNAGGGCYWARMSGVSGAMSEILANENATGPTIVTILESDKAFKSTRCATWTQDLSPLRADPSTPFEDGLFIVGVDVAPGTWKTDSDSGCYWARMGGFSGGMGEILANENAKGSAVVQLAASDKGFKSARCGKWTKVG